MNEGAPGREAIKEFSSKIELDFFRHNDKESDKTKADEAILLTEKGRKDAMGHGELGSLDQAMAFGSPRARTQETAAYHMAGGTGEINGNETLEELKEKINDSLKKEEGSESRSTKLAIDPRLNFILDNKNPYVEAATTAFAEGRLMKFLVEESDQMAEEAGDNESSTYTRQAANVASIIKKYIDIAPRFDALVTDTTKSYLDTMQRFMGTHQSVGECFLAKVIEETKGEAERDRFIKAINNKGFNFSEGFKIELITTQPGEEPKIKIEYKREAQKGGKETEENEFEFNEEVPLEVINKIAAGEALVAA